MARDPVPALGGLRPDLPAAFSRLVDRCLLVDPAARFSSAVELVAALEALPSSELPAHGRPARRMGRWAAAFGAIALALLALWFQRGLLPMGERRLAVMAINRGSAGDAWIAPAIERMAAQRLRDRERRFRVSEGAAAANVLATLSYRRGDKGISLEADVGPKGGRSHRVVATDAASFSDAVNAILEALGDAIGEGQGELGPDPAERGEMARLGTASYEAYRRYRQSLDWYNGARIRDEVETRRRFEQVAGIDPGWAHAHVLLVHASGGARQAALARARASTDPARDPLGQRLLEADELRDQGRYAEAARIAEEVVRAAPDDLAARWSLFENHVGGHENEEAVADLRRLHERRPEQAYGTYLVMLLRLFGRDEQAEELSREWIARAPETQPALVEQADAALSARRPVEALQRARDLFAVYGEDRILRAHLCDRLLRVGYPREARELAEPLLGADELYRGRAHVLLGQIAVLEGRFPAAVESLQAAIALDLPGRVINAYEAGDVYNLLSILSRVLNRPDDAERYKTEEAKIYERWGIRPDMALAQFELELLHAGRLGCPDPEHAMASVTDERQSAPLRQALLGSAAEAGCASCKDLLGAGRPTMEWRQRLLYQFGVCAEAEAELDLARSVYETRILKTRILTPRYFPYDQVLAHFHLARVLERMGLASEASTRYREFLSFWADPSQPIVEVDQARTALQRLEPGGGTP